MNQKPKHYYATTVGIVPPGPRPQAPSTINKRKRKWWPGMVDGEREPTFTADELSGVYPHSMLEKDETSIQNRRVNKKIEAVPKQKRTKLPHHGRALPTGYEPLDEKGRLK